MREKHSMVPGVRYHVTMKDCCIEGSFDAEFVRYVVDPEMSDEADADEYRDAVFRGDGSEIIIGPLWGAWTVAAIREGEKHHD